MPSLWPTFREDSQRQRGALRQARQAATTGPVILLRNHKRHRDGTARLFAPDPATLQQALDLIGFTPRKTRRTAKSWALPAWATERALALVNASQPTGEQADEQAKAPEIE